MPNGVVWRLSEKLVKHLAWGLAYSKPSLLAVREKGTKRTVREQ